MNSGKTLMLAAVLTAAPFAISAASAQNRHGDMSNAPMQTRDRGANDRNWADHRNGGERDMRDRDMRDGDHRDMRHYGWRRGHHYGWRNCMVRWHYHRRVRVCR